MPTKTGTKFSKERKENMRKAANKRWETDRRNKRFGGLGRLFGKAFG